MPTQKNRQEIIDLLTQCGNLSYQNFVDFLYSIPFLYETEEGGSFDSFISKFTGEWSLILSAQGKYDVDYYVVKNNIIYKSTVMNNTSTPGSSLTWVAISNETSFFNPAVVAPGGTLPTTTTKEFMFVGQGTFNNVPSGTIVTTNPFNVLGSNGTTWSLVLSVPINLTDYYNMTEINKRFIDISIIGKNRKAKYLAFDSALKRLVVVGTETTNVSSVGDSQIFNINYLGNDVIFNGTVGATRDFSSLSLVGNMAIVFDKSLTTVALSDLRLIDVSSIGVNDVKIAHITYGTAVTSRWIIDFSVWNERVTALSNSVNLLNDFSDLTVTRRMNKFITYDASTKTLAVVGSNAIAPGDLQIMTLKWNNKTYIIRGAIGAIKVLPLDPLQGPSQIGFPENIADPTNVQLSDFIVQNGQSGTVANFVKLAQVVYNDAINSKVIQDSRYFIFNPVSSFNSINNNFVYNTKVIYRKRKWLAYDRAGQRLVVVGSDASAPSDEQILTFIYDGVSYLLKGFVGVQKTFTGISGNAQFFIPRTVTPGSVTVADIVVFVDSTNRDSTHIKIGHITYNDGLTSEIIIDYKDYVDNQRAINSTNQSFSFLNNSIGENNFANGLQPKLKILGYGNSFMRNSVAYLSGIAKGANVNVTVGNLYTGGTNLSDHLTSLTNNTAPYEYHKYENGVNTVNLFSQQAQYGLNDERWDVVILHQYTPWTQPFEPYLSNLIKLIVQRLGYCPKFYLNATWAGHKDYVLSQYGFATENEMWQYMLDSTRQACTDSGINITSLIPTGTAIQNARTLSYADSYSRFVNSGTDWHHLNSAGGFIAACCVYEKIIYPLNKIHSTETTFRLNAPTAMPPGSQVEAGVLVTDSNYLGMCKCAMDAVTTPNSITSQ